MGGQENEKQDEDIHRKRWTRLYIGFPLLGCNNKRPTTNGYNSHTQTHVDTNTHTNSAPPQWIVCVTYIHLGLCCGRDTIFTRDFGMGHRKKAHVQGPA